MGEKLTDHFEFRRNWRDSRIGSAEFQNSYKTELSRLQIGCSFAPELWQTGEISGGDALTALKVIVEEWGIRHVRLGLRWNRIEVAKGQLSLDAYKPYIDYCLKHGVKLCLNVGPVKTFRWPEIHLPSHVVEDLYLKNSLPADKSTIEEDSRLAKLAYRYLDKLFILLKTDYPSLAQRLDSIQVENEPFTSFGTYGWTSSGYYLENLAIVVKEHFPHTKLLFSSSGFKDSKKILKLFERLSSDNLLLPEQLILGLNYYYSLEHNHQYPHWAKMDNLFWDKLSNLNKRELKHNLKKRGYNAEVTELQLEPWGKAITPGDSLQEFQFCLLRCLQNLSIDGKPLSVRLWGVERLASLALTGELSAESSKIIELITKLPK